MTLKDIVDSVPEPELLTRQVQVRFTEGDFERVRAAAKLDGERSHTAWMRSRVLEAVERVLDQHIKSSSWSPTPEESGWVNRCDEIHPEEHRQCGLEAGHPGAHTVVVPPDAPWAK